MPQAALRPAASVTLLTSAAGRDRGGRGAAGGCRGAVRAAGDAEGRPVARLLDREQRATHGLAWLATYVEALRQLAAYAERMQRGRTARRGRGAAGAHRPRRISCPDPRRHPHEPGRDRAPCRSRALAAAVAARIDPGGRTPDRLRQHRAAPRAPGRADAASSHGATVGACGLDETLDSIREEMRKFADSEVVAARAGMAPHQQLHPARVIAQMSELGVFGLTIPEEFGGMGLGKESMCVVSEELSRGYIGVGSLGTRSEIAAELILGGGTEEQKRKWLPKIASGEVLPTAVFTEPNTGSDLASLKTRAVASRRRLQSLRQQDLDHPSGARRPDDAAGAHRPERSRAIAASPCCSPRSRAAPTRIRSRPPACPAPRSRCSAIAA